MKRAIPLTLIFYLAQISIQAYCQPAGSWKEILSDDFISGPVIDPVKWKDWDGDGDGNFIYYKTAQVPIDNPNNNLIFENAPGTLESVLSIVTRNENADRVIPWWQWWVLNPASKTTHFDHTNSMISSLDKFRFGYYEIRCKLNQDGYDLLDAFWLWGVEQNTYGEIDVFEILPNLFPSLIDIQQSLHCGIGGPYDYNQHVPPPHSTTSADLSNTFHTYGVDWQEQKMEFYFDGQLTKTINYLEMQPGVINTLPIPAPPPFNNPATNASILNMQEQHIVVTVYSDPQFPDPSNPPTLPQGLNTSKLMIDWIKVFKHKPIISGPVLCYGGSGYFTITNNEYDDIISVTVSPSGSATLQPGWTTYSHTYLITTDPNSATTITVKFDDLKDNSDETLMVTSPTPVSVTISPSSGCIGTVTQLSATASGGNQGNGYGYLWSNAATVSNIINPTPGTYTVTVTDANGCTATASAIVYPLPDVTITGPGLTCVLDPYSVPYVAGSVYSWTVPNGVSYTLNSPDNNILTITNWPANVPGGMLSVTVTSPYGCTATGQMQVNECCSATGYTVYNNATLNTSPAPGSLMIINGTMKIAQNSSVTFDHTNILMGQNAIIQVLSGATLTITSSLNSAYSYLRACNKMWNGIRIENGSTGHIIINNRTRIEDGLDAVYIKNPGVLQLHDSYFNKNLVSVHFYEGDFTTSIVTNTEFKCDAVLPPNSTGATQTDVHIKIEYAQNVLIGDLATQNTIINAADKGILSFQSENVTIINNYIKNVRTGISASGRGSIFVNSGNLIQNTNVGIFTGLYTKTNIDGNTLEANSWGILCVTNLDDVDILNNLILNSAYYGILTWNNSLTHQFIKYNTLTSTNQSPGTNKAVGISVVNSANTNPHSCEVSFNEITNHAVGIYFSNCEFTWTESNTITTPVNDNAQNTFTGILSDAGNNLIFYANTLAGQYMNDYIINGFGLWDRTGTNNFTWCNNITGFWHGVEYRNMTTQLDIFGFSGNTMDFCDVELYLNTVPNGLGQQGVAAQPSDNLWDLNCTYNTFADNSNYFLIPPSTEFYVRPNTTVNYEGVLNGNGGFGSNDCVFNVSGDPNAPDFCSYINGVDDEHRQAQRLADGMLQSEDEGLRFNYAMDLLQLFKKYPSITDNSQFMENLNDSLEQTATGDLASINDSLFMVVDSTLSWLQNDSLLDSADSLYIASTNQLKQLNNSITTVVIAQWNRKKVNGIKLNTIAKGIIAFTNPQENTLRFIAGQCELTGGDAVQEARAMLVLTDSLIGNYNSACDSVNYRKGNNKIVSKKNILITPSPNNGKFKITLNEKVEYDLFIYDAIGQIIFNKHLLLTTTEIDLSVMNSGVYSLHFARNGLDEIVKKIVIIK